MAKVFLIMGVSGSGKSHVGELLAKELSLPFIEGDTHHVESSIEKMKSGIPLEDHDRWEWLDRLNHLGQKHATHGCVISCSALKESYRKRLSACIEQKVAWIYLKGSAELIASRMNSRKGHFMKVELLKSQFDALEEPLYALDIDIREQPEEIINRIKKHFEL